VKYKGSGSVGTKNMTNGNEIGPRGKTVLRKESKIKGARNGKRGGEGGKRSVRIYTGWVYEQKNHQNKKNPKRQELNTHKQTLLATLDPTRRKKIFEKP